MLSDGFIYLASFFAIWTGAGLIVSSADRFSKKLKLSSFTVSFFILGFLTSTPEFAVGMTSVAEKNPEIFIGNLIGGIPVIFLMLVPLLAILGNGVNLSSQFTPAKVFFSFFVIMTPTFFILNKTVTFYEALIMLGLYALLFFVIQREKGLLDITHSKLLSAKSYSLFDILKVLAGVVIVFISSQIIVDKTIYFAEELNLSIFIISLLLLSIGTNLPELSLAVKSIVLGKKDVAFGDYVGSAATNTFIFGLLTILIGGTVTTSYNFMGTFLIMLLGLVAFFYFSQSGNNISRKEGFMLLSIYIAFVVFETLT